MNSNNVIDTIMNRKSIRKYTKEQPSTELLNVIVRAGQQAPFAYQLCSVLLSRKQPKNPFKAPLLFTICVDTHRMELVMERRGWKMAQNDLSLLIFGFQDAAYLAENMVIAGESFGLGSCFIGDAPYRAEKIISEYHLPKRVFPMVQLVMGFPAENPPVRPRWPLEFALFEDQYPEFSEETIQASMRQMDEGYISQNYYRKAKYIIPLEGEREETYSYDDYSWTEHISRKIGLWLKSPEEILTQMRKCGFNIPLMDLIEN